MQFFFLVHTQASTVMCVNFLLILFILVISLTLNRDADVNCTWYSSARVISMYRLIARATNVRAYARSKMFSTHLQCAPKTTRRCMLKGMSYLLLGVERARERENALKLVFVFLAGINHFTTEKVSQ